MSEIEELRAEVARLLAECVDRESERGDLRDRVQKAEGAVARVEVLADEAQLARDVHEKRHIHIDTWLPRLRAALEDPS